MRTPPSKLRSRTARIVVLGATVLIAAACRSGRQAEGGPPNLVLVSLDTLRADHLGCYGYARPTSPNIDALASRATLFRNAFSTASKTAESHMSMFTSLYPGAHGVVTLVKAAPGDEVPTLGPSVRTLAQMLQERGYATAGFHGNAFVDAKFGFDRGFDVYETTKLGPALEWLEENAADGPFFLFFHTYHVHDPYTPRPPGDAQFTETYDGRIVHDMKQLQEIAGSAEWMSYSNTFWSLVDPDDPRDVAHLRALYDAEIVEVDRSVQRLLDLVDRLAPNTWFVIVSDHGEEFGEHGQFKHSQVYDELLRVPWIFRAPGQTEGRIVSDPVSTIDLTPTLLDLLSIPPTGEAFQGRSLRPLLEAHAREAAAAKLGGLGPGAAHAAADPAPLIFSELPLVGLSAIRDERWKLISTRNGFELYDHVADPGERQNLLAAGTAPSQDARDAFDELRAALERRQAENREIQGRNAAAGQGRRLDDETVEQMRALGYID